MDIPIRQGYSLERVHLNAFVALPRWVDQKISHISRQGTAKLEKAMLSGFAFWYIRYGPEEYDLKYLDGTTYRIKEGQFVSSVENIARSMFTRLFSREPKSGAGDRSPQRDQEFISFYQKCLRSTTKLENDGYIRRVKRLKDRGRHGTVWTMGTWIDNADIDRMVYLTDSPVVLFRPDEGGAYINAVEVVGRILASGEDCDYSENAVSVYKRGKYVLHDGLIRTVARKGDERERFTNAGKFHSSIRNTKDTYSLPVRYSWLPLDIDGDDVLDSYNIAAMIVDSLAAEGVDVSRIIVNYTGGRGFHVRIPSAMFGDPAFVHSSAAYDVMRKFCETAIDVSVDNSTLNPRQLVRLIGSKHKKGGYSVAMAADEFMAHDIDEILERSKQHEPFDLKPDTGPPDPFLAASMMSAVDIVEHKRKKQSYFRKGGSIFNPTFAAAYTGVSEGDAWGDNHYGRNNAAFVVACHLIRRHEERKCETLLHEWNKRNDPPLGLNELQTCFRSACRAVKKEKSNVRDRPIKARRYNEQSSPKRS